MKLPAYIDHPTPQHCFCLTHKRPATHLLLRSGMAPKIVCNPQLGGITIPCRAFDYADNSRTARYQRMDDNQALLYTSVITYIYEEILKRYATQSIGPKRPDAGQRRKLAA